MGREEVEDVVNLTYIKIEYDEIVKFQIVLSSSEYPLLKIRGNSYNITEAGYLFVFNMGKIVATLNRSEWISISIIVEGVIS